MSANHVLLQRFELSASSPVVSFTNIPQTGYKDLKVVVSARGSSSNILNLSMQINNNGTSGAYSYFELTGNGSTASSGNSTGTYLNSIMPGSSISSNMFSSNEIYFHNYTSSYPKTMSVDAVTENNAASTDVQVRIQSWGWSGTDPIKTLSFYNAQGASFVAGSTFSLYGIAELNVSPSSGPKAYGGDIIANDGVYWYHAFLSTGNFKPRVSMSCDYLMIAGGGAGGSSPNGQQGGGGGGAGGLLSSLMYSGGGASASPKLNLSAGVEYTATIGAGGTTNASGGNTTFAGLTAIGGGYGGISGTGSGATGGSGGGGSSSSSPGSGGAGTTGQGYAGGAGQGGNNYACGGGGGAGGAGVNGGNANDSINSRGGVGLHFAEFALVTGTGYNEYFAGGGGGGFGQFGNFSSGSGGGYGGVGGGGNGATATTNTAAVAGVANTGGGGGGSCESGRFTNSAVGGNGGSGIVIVRYAMA